VTQFIILSFLSGCALEFANKKTAVQRSSELIYCDCRGAEPALMLNRQRHMQIRRPAQALPG